MISATSIRSRLFNIAQKEEIAFQVVVTRYLHERFLYRLSVSKYAGHFYLKGGNFIYALQGLLTRPTVDIDLSGQNTSNDPKELQQVFQEILSVSCDDAVKFDEEKITTEQITENSEYGGIRLFFPAAFDTVKQRIQIDIGFGDKITPKPVKIKFPVLIQGVPAPELLAYTIETVIAEKFQTMVFLGTINSRMKDFYDVYQLLINENVNEQTLKDAIKVTFQARGTELSREHSIFSETFQDDPTRITMWNAFLKKIKREREVTFQEVMQVINKKLL
ncbi:nucleotidyl transferase AbiEii/AbiGii toxin family protein [Niabella hirudinis]|uniref:nucleotidyl transferase AbiEii/AbiGii toxin family protein n=1 Tax=Niabella hirudinis TaxID=1285929 RepID=UPI003EBA339D